MTHRKQYAIEVEFLELLHAAREVRKSLKRTRPEWDLRTAIIFARDDLYQERVNESGAFTGWESWDYDERRDIGGDDGLAA